MAATVAAEASIIRQKHKDKDVGTYCKARCSYWQVPLLFLHWRRPLLEKPERRGDTAAMCFTILFVDALYAKACGERFYRVLRGRGVKVRSRGVPEASFEPPNHL